MKKKSRRFDWIPPRKITCINPVEIRATFNCRLHSAQSPPSGTLLLPGRVLGAVIRQLAPHGRHEPGELLLLVLLHELGLGTGHGGKAGWGKNREGLPF